jgi:soluble lytic murein transglycosylase-like protein
MPSKKRRAVSGALLGVATTALTVKGALAGPLGGAAQEPLRDAKDRLHNVAEMAAAATIQLTVPSSRPGSPLSQLRAPAAVRVTRPARPANAATIARRDDSYTEELIKTTLRGAAARHGLDPNLVLAVSYWESGWDQSMVSAAGAVGVMQVEPDTAHYAGPTLLGRNVDLNDLYDNADIGAAILREDLDNFKDPVMALAAYYEGPTTLEQNGLTADAQQYADGVLSLAPRMSE